MKAQIQKLKKAITSNPLLTVFAFVGITVLAVSISSQVAISKLTKTSEQNFRDKLLEAARRLSMLTTAEEINSYREPSDAERPEWKALREKLVKLGKEANILYAYYLRVEGDKVQYIVDNDFDEETRVGIDTKPVKLSAYIDLLPALEGKEMVTRLGEYAQDWPGLCSAYVPIFNSDGSVAAIAAVDEDDRPLRYLHITEHVITLSQILLVAIVFASGWFGLKNLQRMVKAKTRDIVRLQNAILRGVANMVESRDDATGGHVERTQQYLRALIGGLNKMGLYQEDMRDWDVELMIESSQLHDVGKIAISDSILKKPGRLTKEEFDTMKKHVEFGVGIIEKIESEVSGTDFFRYAKIFAETHHEKWDGSGYPSGLVGSDIPLLGRLMALADVYDALTSARPYKEAFPPEEAARIIREGRGSHFDPILVDAFEQVADQFALIASQPMNRYVA